MALSRWLRNLRDVTERIVRHAAIGLGVVSAATGQSAAAPRVPVNPEPILVPNREEKKLGGKFVLQRTQAGPRVVFAAHRSHSSHSSHSSHASHASHSSSSHYSGSHFSSSPSPTPSPSPSPPSPKPPPTYAPPPLRAVTPESPVSPLALHETFDSTESATRWQRGLLVHPLGDHDRALDVSIKEGVLKITPRASTAGRHFYGVVSARQFNLATSSIAADVFEVPSGGAAAIMAAGTDASHYVAFIATASQLVFDHRSGEEQSRTTIAYDAHKHRFWRFRQLTPGVVAWETSADSKTWHLQHATEASFPLDTVSLELGAGTDRFIEAPGAAIFDNIDVVER